MPLDTARAHTAAASLIMSEGTTHQRDQAENTSHPHVSTVTRQNSTWGPRTHAIKSGISLRATHARGPGFADFSDPSSLIEPLAARAARLR